MTDRPHCVGDIPDNVVCCHCNGVLQEPVQTVEGVRLCKKCFEAIIRLPGRECKNCGVIVTSDEFYRDKAVELDKKEILVWCQFESFGCSWKGKLKELKDHRAVCTHKHTTCHNEGCGMVMKVDQLQDHEQDCPHRLVKCQTCGMHIPFNLLESHISKCGPIESYSAASSSAMFPVSKSQQEEIAKLRQEEIAKLWWWRRLSINVAASAGGIMDMIARFVSVVSRLPNILNLPEEMQNVKTEVEKNQVLTQRVKELEEERMTSYNGTLLWKIPGVAQLRRNTRHGPVPYIESPVFYTNRHGYKMRVRFYPNGCGEGFQNYLSLYLIVIPGDYDVFLKWPFKCPVSFSILDQTNHTDITQTFDPISEFGDSQKKPKAPLSIAPGCPVFHKLSVLEDSHYVEDDVMFMKCVIDSTDVVYPGHK